MLTEKQAARYCQRTLTSASKRLIDQAGKYGEDVPYIESLMQQAIDKLKEIADEMELIAKE